METQVVFGKIVFSDKWMMVLRKRKNVIIYPDDIKRLVYVRPTFWNYFNAGIGAAGIYYPKNMLIFLKKRICRSNYYYVKIKYKEFYKLPEWVKKIVEIQ